ncbi:MAG: glycosyltransferase, partial [Gammaproteobacteria bacterium]
SMNQRRPKPDLPWLANCPNALDFSVYPVQPHPGDYLLFLGRMSHEKGCHRAIAVATELGLPLKIAGKSREPKEQEYFDEFVRPHLSERIEYLGEVNHGQKVELLQDARATLFPIEWEEPFGLVMIESMACGTPVIGARVGGIKSTVVDGKTGFLIGPKDHDALAHRLACLYRNPALARLFGQRGIRRVNQGYTWQKVATSIAALYQGVALGMPLRATAGHRLR